jgi:hypothetical protein
MDTILLENKFARIGARLKLADRPSRRNWQTSGTISLDVQEDPKGEFFEILDRSRGNGLADVEVLDVQSAERHLLLLVRENGEKHKFLCGHDERHWFVAAIPEVAPVGTVGQAKEALKPAEVHSAQASKKLRARARGRRKNAAYVRQGEWFFLKAGRLLMDQKLVLQNEPLIRGSGGKPHWADHCYRTGGETVYVCAQHPNGVTEAQRARLISNDPRAIHWNWRAMRRNMTVDVRGRVRHADHRTIVLHEWHRVVMNTENQSKAMRNLACLD